MSATITQCGRTPAPSQTTPVPPAAVDQDMEKTLTGDILAQVQGHRAIRLRRQILTRSLMVTSQAARPASRPRTSLAVAS